ALATIPYDKSKHAAEMLHAIAAIFLVEVNNRFGVAASAVAVPLGLEIGAQVGVVIDFAVVDNPDVMVFVGKRLMAGLNVNNAQPPHGQTDIFLDEKPFVVGSAMHNALIHAGEHVALDMPVPIREKNATDSTHISPGLRFVSRKFRYTCQVTEPGYPAPPQRPPVQMKRLAFGFPPTS